MPIVLKSGSLNLPEPSGPVQACNGTALQYLILIPVNPEVWNISSDVCSAAVYLRCLSLIQRVRYLARLWSDN
jgi:hypothetical protein